MALRESTIEAQSKFSDYCRTGELQPIEGTLEDRLPHYRRLVYNVVKNALNTAFPIAHKKYVNKEDWENLQYRFFSSHHCSNPQIWKMPAELFPYIEGNEAELMEKYPALLDLLRFEWQETELFMMSDLPIDDHSGEKPSMSDIPVLEPEMQLLPLTYPVHNTHPSQLADAVPAQYVSMAWRNRDTKLIHFMNISVFFAVFLEVLSSGELTIAKAAQKTAVHTGVDPSTIDNEVEKFIANLHSKGLIFKA